MPSIVLKTQKPNRKPYPKELKTYGDHIRKKRLDLNLSQPQLAKLLNVQTDTITNWELNRNTPRTSHIPRIISFLGYSLENHNCQIKNYRIENGITQKEMAKRLAIDWSTLANIESGKTKRISERIQGKIQEMLNNPLKSKSGVLNSTFDI